MPTLETFSVYMKSGFPFRYKMLMILSFIASLAPLKALANTCGETVLHVGWFNATQGKSQHINIEGLIGDDFSINKSSDQNFLVGAGYYFNWINTPCINIQYGIDAFYLAPTRVKGDVTQENLFTNLSYQYSCSNYPIYFAAKALIPCSKNHEIVIDLGIGPNIISTSSFKEKSLDAGITNPDTIFSGRTTATFSATAGLGWRINRSFGIDYRFFYLGEGKLKTVNSQVRNSLCTGNSYANALFFSIYI